MALTFKFAVGTITNTSGTSGPGTSPNTAAGDLAIDDLVIVGVGKVGAFGGSGSPSVAVAAGALSLQESFPLFGFNSIWIGIYRCTSAIVRNTVYTPSWTTAGAGIGTSIVAYSATETFAGYYALAGARNSAETVGPTFTAGLAVWPASALNLTPTSVGAATGLGFRFMWAPLNNASITQGTGWTARRDTTTTGVQIFTADNFRTVGGAYGTQATGMSASAFDRGGIAVHVPTGAAPAAGRKARAIVLPSGAVVRGATY